MLGLASAGEKTKLLMLINLHDTDKNKLYVSYYPLYIYTVIVRNDCVFVFYFPEIFKK